MDNKIQKICVNYLMNAANLEELKILEHWLKEPKNQQIFANYLKINYAMDINMNPYNTESAKQEFLKKIRKERQSIRRRKRIRVFGYSAAASVLLFIAATFFLDKGNTVEPQFVDPIVVNNQVDPGGDKATLTLETGETVVLGEGKQYQNSYANSNGEEITYQDNSASKKIAYNYLTVPRGGQFQITLADSTRVWLNSESQLKYPVSFKSGETRQVELVYGEAYFDVSPSTYHNGATFKVLNQSQEIEVLGTEFNIKAYKDEFNIYTTLVEGKVAVKSQMGSQTLKPNEQANLNISNNIMTTSVVNVYDEISWKEGVFSFQGKPLKDIVKTLTRWYNIDFVFENVDAKEKRFNGVLKRNVKINEVLDVVKRFGIIEDYEIKNDTITLK